MKEEFNKEIEIRKYEVGILEVTSSISHGN
jgi:hypothetical protein